MVFALSDYINYRRRAGRYCRSTGTDIMCGAYEESLPEEIMLVLQPNDLILVGNFGWWMSWLIMYLTTSQISHVAVYVGDGKILHATLFGPEHMPVHTLFGPRIRLLACKAPIPCDRRIPPDAATIQAFDRRRYSILLVLWKAAVILSGRDVLAFRWRFFFDIALLSIAFDLIAAAATGRPLGFWYAVLAYLALIVLNRFCWPPPPSSPVGRHHGKPSDILRWIVQSGEALLPDPMSPWAQRAYSEPESPWESHVFRRKDRST